MLKATLQISAEDKTRIVGAANPPLTVSMTGFVPGDTAGVLSGAPTVTTVATTGSPVGAYPIVPAVGTLSAANYRFDFAEGTLSVVYASVGPCLGEPGHAVLQPINGDGTSVFKKGSTVPAKFRVCDAAGSSIGAPGTVTGFNLVQTISGTVSSSVNEPVDSSTPFTEFRWDASSQKWIFNMATRGLTDGQSYVFRITLNDATNIDFRFGIR